MVKPSIKTITLKNLLTFLLLALLILMVTVALNFRYISRKILENEAQAVSEIVLASLTSHMKAGIMDRRDYLLEEIKTIAEVKSITVIRSPSVVKQFGPGLEIENYMDEVTKRVFETKKPEFIIDEYSTEPTIRAVIPYIATKEGPLNCLECHHVEENLVIGAVDIVLDLTEYRRTAFWILIGMSALSAIFVILIIINTFRTIEKYIKKPLENLIDKAREAYLKHKPVSLDAFETLEFEKVAKEINLFNTEILDNQQLLEEKNRELIALNDEIEETLKETVFTMGVIEEKRSMEMRNHTMRVVKYSELLGRKAGLSEKEVELLKSAAPLHDIGKLGIADSILLKPGSLTSGEFEIMTHHTEIGYIMLMHSKRTVLKAAATIAYQHHEKWDGTGYPRGLKGEEIHIFGRIVALADVFDALASKRIYKETWGTGKIIKGMRTERGKRFDPKLVDIFLENFNEFMEIWNRYAA